MKEKGTVMTLAKAMAVCCVRNTVIENYHARGSLSQEDMKAFNREVANKLYTWLTVIMTGTEAEKSALSQLANLFMPTKWDKPLLDADTIEAVRMIEKKGMPGSIDRTL